MMLLKRSTASAVCALLLASSASAQVINSGHVIGNGTASPAAPTDTQLLGVMQQSGSGIGSGVAGVLGGAGALGPFTAGLPIIGNGSSGFAAATKSGTSTLFPVIDGTHTNGQCAVFDSAGGLSSIACTPSGSGTVGSGLAQQYAFYPNNGTSIVGFQAPFLHSKNFGAVGNGTALDEVALQNWVNACEASGQACFLDPGTYLLENASGVPTPLSVTSSVTITAPNFISSAFLTPVSIDAINVNTASPVYFYNFGVSYPTTATSGTAAISVTAGAGAENSSSIFRDLRILNPQVGMVFDHASGYTVDNVKIELFAGNAFNIANSNNPDSGDSTITSGEYIGIPGSNSCVFWVSSGGLKFIHNKCLTTANGFQIDLAAGANTSQILVNDNSFDGITSTGLVIGRQSTTGSLVEVVFDDNTCSSALQCVVVGFDSTLGSWVKGIQVSGNTYFGTNSGANVFAEFSSGLGITAVNNTLISNAATTTAFICNGNAATATFGIFTKTGTFAANSNSCGATAISPN